MKKLHLVIVSGLSGSGKSAVLNCFEDIGFFCVDNLPPPLLPKFVELCLAPGSEVNRVALGLDIRNREFLNAFGGIYKTLGKAGYPVELIFMEADTEVLIRRFSESRRPHPLAKGRSVLEGIAEEREKLAPMREIANQIIDTSNIVPSDLKKTIERGYLHKDEKNPLHISLLSFGFKFGVPSDLDMLFDVRFLKNPYFERTLRFQTGHDKPVQDFVYAQEESERFMTKLVDMLDFLVPLYEHEGKSYLTVGIGCTGGRHRSVSILNLLNEVLKQKGLKVSARHRDVHRPPAT